MQQFSPRHRPWQTGRVNDHMDREKLDGWCEKGILGLVLAILTAAPLLFGGTGEPVVFGGATGAWHFLPLQALTLGVIILWGARIWLAPRPKLLWPPICWVVLAFVIYAGIHYTQAEVEYPARLELIQITVYALLFLAILNNLHGQWATQIISLTLVATAMLIAFYAIYQCVMKYPRVWNVASPYPGRGSGTFINPNNLAAYLELILPAAICFLLAGRLGQITKVALGYAALVILGGIGVSASRGGCLSTALMLIVLCGVLLSQRNYRLQAGLLLLVLVGIGWLVWPRMSMLQARLTGASAGNYAGDTRWYIWRAAFDIWRDHPVWGVGPAQFDPWFPAYRPVEVQMRPLLAHNDYLNTLADYGLVGAVLVAATVVLLGTGVVGTWRHVRGARDDFARKQSSKFAFTLGALGGLLAILIHAFLDYNLHVPAVALVAVTWMALLSSQWRFATERFWYTAGIPLRCVATLVLLVGLAGLARAGWRGAQESAALDLAGQQPAFSHAQIAAFQKAAAVEPANPETAFYLGECYRRKSFEGSDEYPQLARHAMDWYRRGMVLNPQGGNNWLGYGQCLDWVAPQAGARGEDSLPYFQRALELDPNGEFTSFILGWHYVNAGDYAAARTCFERARSLTWNANEEARDYLGVVDRRMREAAGSEK